jgi:hypothetical protein
MNKCSKCGLGVIITKTKVIKACECNAPIIVEVSTKLKGIGMQK